MECIAFMNCPWYINLMGYVISFGFLAWIIISFLATAYIIKIIITG